jgi:hypothetical protein
VPPSVSADRTAAPGLGPSNLLPAADAAVGGLQRYLAGQGNSPEDISRCRELLQKRAVILEIGCGGGETAWQIARKNPDIGVIATDLYDWEIPESAGSRYRKVALAWRERRLPVQQAGRPNLVLLRSKAELLRHLPDASVDTLLVVNAEPAVGRALLTFLHENRLHRRLRTGDRSIVILPFCREMGVCACGGFEFEHAADWSRGLGYLMESAFEFRKGDPVQWGVLLRAATPYSCNSTQTDVFVWSHRDPGADAPAPRKPRAQGLGPSFPLGLRRKPSS